MARQRDIYPFQGIQNNYGANYSWISEALFLEAKQPGHTKQAMYT